MGFLLLDNFRVQINTTKLRLENSDKKALISPSPCKGTCAFTLVVFMQVRSSHGWFSVSMNTWPWSLFLPAGNHPAHTHSLS